MVEILRGKKIGRAARSIKKLYQMLMDYPTDILRCALSEALAHGLSDLERIEKMVLTKIEGEFFQLAPHPTHGGNHEPGD